MEAMAFGPGDQQAAIVGAKVDGAKGPRRPLPRLPISPPSLAKPRVHPAAFQACLVFRAIPLPRPGHSTQKPPEVSPWMRGLARGLLRQDCSGRTTLELLPGPGQVKAIRPRTAPDPIARSRMIGDQWRSYLGRPLQRIREPALENTRTRFGSDIVIASAQSCGSRSGFCTDAPPSPLSCA